MDDIQRKIQTSAGYVDIALKIAQILLWIIIILLVGVLLTCLAYGMMGPDDLSQWVTAESIPHDFAGEIIIPENTDPIAAFTGILGVLVISAITYLALLAAMLRFAGEVFADIRKTALPFTTANARRLKNTAVCMGLLAVLPWVIGIIGSFVINIQLTISYLSIELLITAAVLYCLAYIFEYGTLLQQQADETL